VAITVAGDPSTGMHRDGDFLYLHGPTQGLEWPCVAKPSGKGGGQIWSQQNAVVSVNKPLAAGHCASKGGGATWMASVRASSS